MSELTNAASKAAAPGLGIATSAMDLVDTIVGGAFDIVSLNKQQELAYQQFLADTFPEYKQFFVFDNSRDYRNIYIIAAMVFLIIVLVIVISQKEKKDEKK